MTKSELAEGICSEKYIYLIETDKRNPSVDLLIQLGMKLGIDLLSYTPYLDCQDPIMVKAYVDEFSKLRINNRYDLLIEASERANLIPDFCDLPWKIEIHINDILYQLLIKTNYFKVTLDIEKLLTNYKKYMMSEQKTVLYLTQSIAYQGLNKIENSRNALKKATTWLSMTQINARHTEYTISIKLNELSLESLCENYEGVCKLGEALTHFQFEQRTIDRLHFTFAFLAIAHYQLNDIETAGKYLKKCIMRLNIEFRPNDLHLLKGILNFEKVLKYFDALKELDALYGGDSKPR